MGRFRDQRWLLDKVIEAVGPDFDQSRLQYYSAPMGVDHCGPVMGLKAQIRRVDDMMREFARLARRCELQAQASLAQGREVTAGDGFFSASVVYGAAQWPIVANTDLTLALERKKTDCYAEFAKFADHRIKAVEIPYGDRTLAGWFHLPPGYAGGKVPCLIMVSGSDAFKELQICASADRFLRRGFACLMLDGPGQGTSLTRGIWYDPDRYGDVGTAAFEAMATRPEVDAKRTMV